VDPVVTVARSFCWASDPVGLALVHALKYHGWRNVATDLAARLARLDLGPVSPDVPRVLVPVPLAPRRQQERGYNQSECLARALALHWRARVAADLVGRARETPSQTRLTPEQRLHNVADAFRVDARRVAAVGNAAFVLVDDVITTGATLNACAAALASAGARTICYITFGRARDPRDALPSRGTISHGHSGRH
jgi:ComF family protein